MTACITVLRLCIINSKSMLNNQQLTVTAHEPIIPVVSELAQKWLGLYTITA
jgi:hypothetical protein